METIPTTSRSLDHYYHINGDTFEKQYKEVLSGYREWSELSHAEDWLVFPENIGESICNHHCYCKRCVGRCCKFFLFRLTKLISILNKDWRKEDTVTLRNGRMKTFLQIWWSSASIL